MNTDMSVSGEFAGKVYNVYTAADQLANSTHIAGSPILPAWHLAADRSPL